MRRTCRWSSRVLWRQCHAALACVGLAVAVSGCRPAPNREAPQGETSGSAATRPRGATDVATFNEHVAPILYEHCATCHRPIDAAPSATPSIGDTPGAVATLPPGGDPLCVAGAPFSVLDYRFVRPRAADIATAVTSRAMPPWLPEPGHGDFSNARRLSAEHIATIQRWAASGALEGDAASRPSPPVFPDRWQLGVPDLVLTSEEAYTLPAGSGDAFRTFVLPVPTSPTRYVRGIEFLADNPRVLHHANVALDPQRVGRRLDQAEPGAGFATMPEGQVQDVYGWSPGKVPAMEPSDTAWSLDEGSDLVVQLHMVAGRTSEQVRPRVGLFFASERPTRVPVTIKLESKAIDIPAGVADYVVEDQYVLPADVEVTSVYPHAHYLAREMRGTATRPDGTEAPLIWIRDWDLRWQDQYRFRQPLALPKGTTLRMRFTYDNSSRNANNPFTPPRNVVWGPLSTDEMGALWLEVVPRRPGDALVLARDFFARALQADIASAELRARKHPTSAPHLNALASVYLRAGRVDDAVARLHEALAAQPTAAEARSNLGTALQARGDMPAASRHLREAARLRPKDDRIRFNLGNWLLAAGRTDDALREFRTAVALNPENEDAHFNLAVVLGPRNQLAEAVGHLRRVIAINPRNGEGHRNLALALSLQGQPDEALLHAQSALRLQPESLAARQLLEQLVAARSGRPSSVR